MWVCALRGHFITARSPCTVAGAGSLLYGVDAPSPLALLLPTPTCCRSPWHSFLSRCIRRGACSSFPSCLALASTKTRPSCPSPNPDTDTETNQRRLVPHLPGPQVDTQQRRWEDPTVCTRLVRSLARSREPWLRDLVLAVVMSTLACNGLMVARGAVPGFVLFECAADGRQSCAHRGEPQLL